MVGMRLLAPQPDQFIALGRRDDLHLLLAASVPSIGHGDPMMDRLRGEFELTSEIIWIAARADTFDYSPAKFRKVRQAGFGHVGCVSAWNRDPLSAPKSDPSRWASP
jgi:hypothetical protein